MSAYSDVPGLSVKNLDLVYKWAEKYESHHPLADAYMALLQGLHGPLHDDRMYGVVEDLVDSFKKPRRRRWRNELHSIVKTQWEQRDRLGRLVLELAKEKP